jgi:hypothetical protein
MGRSWGYDGDIMEYKPMLITSGVIKRGKLGNLSISNTTPRIDPTLNRAFEGY